jgi:hypothetical protein
MLNEAKIKSIHNFFIKFLINFSYGVITSDKFNLTCTNHMLITEYVTPYYIQLQKLLPNNLTEIYIDEAYVIDNSPQVEKSIIHVTTLLGLPFTYTKLTK